VDEEGGGKEIDSINVSSDWVNRIDYMSHIIGSRCLSVKYLPLRWISEAPEYKPISPTSSEQLKEIIQDEMKTAQGAREVQEQVEDGKEVLDPDNTSPVLSTVLNTINNKFDHECLDEAVGLLDVHPIRQSTDDHVQG